MSLNTSRRSLLRGRPGPNPSRRPPWTGLDFTDQCTRCGDCVSACPEQVLFKGDGGFPEIRFGEGECTFCQACADVCEAPVFDLTRKAFPWHATPVQPCLALNNIHCQSCQDACDAAAVKFRPALGHVPRPEVDPDLCTGCGACVSVCPVDGLGLEDASVQV
ncbi:ferredoxin-type protein NapF [Marinobacter salicampi]|uniref:ferredoxin-type protein NapF n=1 Tax=Marinobacter salicampi TaxID=435907 RepID=UPI0014086009|nr:ferredoxin-type protein NapF [Marinobacter salicampi]